METQESITGIDTAFHLKSDLNLKGGFDRAPKAGLICSKIHLKQNRLPCDVLVELLSFLGNGIITLGSF